jgi:hypothetical protein
MINPNWVRWAVASFSKHFADTFSAASVPLFCEGDDRNTAKVKDFAEFRMDGPKIRELSRGYYHLFVPVNILVKSNMDDANVHRIHRTIGTAISAFADHISMFKYGPDGVIDDGSLVTCFSRMDNLLDQLKVSQFGQIDPTVRVQQATVEGHYEAYITE